MILKNEARKAMRKIGLKDVKMALGDTRFRETLPQEMKMEVAKYLQNPTCNCNFTFLLNLLKNCRKQLSDYFPGKEVASEDEEMSKLAQNHWTVINCNKDELEDRMRALPPGRKQIAIARYMDEVTVLINEIDVL